MYLKYLHTQICILIYMNIYLMYIYIHTYTTLVIEEEEVMNLRGSSSGGHWKELRQGREGFEYSTLVCMELSRRSLNKKKWTDGNSRRHLHHDVLGSNEEMSFFLFCLMWWLHVIHVCTHNIH